jgi:hypothetical protein
VAPWRWTVAFLELSMLSVSLPSWATTFEVKSTTLLQARSLLKEGEEQTVIPIIEVVDFDARQLHGPFFDNLSLRLSAWGRIDPPQHVGQLGNGADLDLAYLSGSLWSDHLKIQLGRFFAVGGAARVTHLDGGVFDADLFYGIGVSAWGGLPVVARFAAAKGDVVAGARLYYRASLDTEIAASFEQLWDHGETARRQVGIDARTVIKGVTLSGFGLWSLVDSRLAEADISATWNPFRPFSATLEVRRTAPDLFLPRTSILSVFASDSHDEAGASVSWRAGYGLTFFVQYHYLRYAAEGSVEDLSGEDGHEAVARITWNAPVPVTLGLSGRYLDAPSNGCFEGRLFGMWRLGHGLSATFDLDSTQLREAVNGRRDSFTSSLSLAWVINSSWMATLTGLASVTPYFDSRLEGVAKLVYNFSTRSSEERP